MSLFALYRRIKSILPVHAEQRSGNLFEKAYKWNRFTIDPKSVFIRRMAIVSCILGVLTGWTIAYEVKLLFPSVWITRKTTRRPLAGKEILYRYLGKNTSWIEKNKSSSKSISEFVSSKLNRLVVLRATQKKLGAPI